MDVWDGRRVGSSRLACNMEEVCAGFFLIKILKYLTKTRMKDTVTQ